MPGQTQRRFYRTATISNQAAQDINKEILKTAMTCMLDLRDILQLIDDRFNDCTAAQKDAISPQHEFVFHIGTQFRDQLKVEHLEQVQCERLRDVAFISKKLTKELFRAK